MSNRTSSAMIGRLAAAAVLIGLPAVAAAQIQQLPATSRSEGQLNQMNNEIAQQQQIRGIQQQNQIETNRTQMQIQTAPQPVPVPVAPIGGRTR